MDSDYYQMLGLTRTATIVDIKRAYRRLIRQYHPDVVPQTPETLKCYQELTHAYEVLSDPHERLAYDRKLPKRSYPVPGLAPDALWREVSELMLQKSDRFGPLQQAMRAAVPITREDQTLVVGIAGQHQYLAGHLMTAANRHFVNQCLQEVSGEPVQFRLIEGTTAEDWEVVKKSEAIAAQKAGKGKTAAAGAPAADTQPAGAPAAAAWTNLQQRLGAAWNQVPQRQLAAARAQFLLEAIPLLYQAEADAIAEDQPDDAIPRQLNRAIERIASLVEVPPALVALELLHYRQERGF